MKILRNVVIVILLLVLFRGFVYRLLVNYAQVEVRNNIALSDAELIQKIDKALEGKTLTIAEIIAFSNDLTSENLSFTFAKVSSNPNDILDSKKANCIGYSALFNSIGNYVIDQQNMSDQYVFVHLVGELYVLGFNVHRLFDNPFFKDHDFNKIAYKQTNTSYFVDPSLSDYFHIDYVKSK